MADTKAEEKTETFNDRPLCGGCNKPISDDSHIAALDSLYHKSCFVCYRCKNAFEGGVFFEHEGQPYCKRHHLQLFCAECAKCGQPVETGVTLQDRTYHTDHFMCDDCGVSLVDQAEVLLPDDGAIYCTEHFRQRFAPKCPGCNKALEGDVIQAVGQSFHAACFKCVECNKVLDKYCDKDGDAYCAACFTDKFTPKSKCSACGDDIPHGAKMKVFDAFWHKDCLKCHVCGVQFLGTDTMYSVQARLFCEPHYLATLDRCHECVEPITGEFLTVGDNKYHKPCLKCAICEDVLNPELLWKRELAEQQELVCEKHSRGPLSFAAIEVVVKKRSDREQRREAASKASHGINNTDSFAAVYVPGAPGASGEGGARSGAGAGAGAGVGAGAGASVEQEVVVEEEF